MFKNLKDRIAFAEKLESALDVEPPEGFTAADHRVSIDMSGDGARWLAGALRRSTIDLDAVEQIQPRESAIDAWIRRFRADQSVALDVTDALYLLERNAMLRESLVAVNERLAGMLYRVQNLENFQLPEGDVPYTTSDRDFMPEAVFKGDFPGVSALKQMAQQLHVMQDTGEIDMNSFTQNGFAALIGIEAEAVTVEGDMQTVNPLMLKGVLEQTREAMHQNPGLKYTSVLIRAYDGGLDVEMEIAQA
jgi:hypothetical protein